MLVSSAHALHVLFRYLQAICRKRPLSFWPETSAMLAPRLTRDREEATESSTLHPPNIPKTSPTPACSAPGCQKTQHHCHRTRQKLRSSSCETQPLKAYHSYVLVLVSSRLVGRTSSSVEFNEPVENENTPSVTPDLLLPLSNYTFTAGLERTSQTSHAAGLVTD